MDNFLSQDGAVAEYLSTSSGILLMSTVLAGWEFWEAYRNWWGAWW